MRLRRELHDGLGPTLAALGLKVDRARAEATADPAAVGPLLDEIRSDLRGALSQIRTMARELRPPGLDALGLVDALRQQLATIGGPGGPVVTIEARCPRPRCRPRSRSPPTGSRSRPSRTPSATPTPASCGLTLARGRDTLTVEIADDGAGIGDRTDRGRHAGDVRAGGRGRRRAARSAPGRTAGQSWRRPCRWPAAPRSAAVPAAARPVPGPTSLGSDAMSRWPAGDRRRAGTMAGGAGSVADPDPRRRRPPGLPRRPAGADRVDRRTSTWPARPRPASDAVDARRPPRRRTSS